MTETAKYYLASFFALVGVTGLLTNGALAFILSKRNVRDNLPNALVLNLALADLFVILFSLPFATIGSIASSYPFGDFVCKMSASSHWIAVGVSAMTLFVMSVFSLAEERIATLLSTPAKRFASIVLIWVLAIPLTVSTIIYAHVFEFTNGDKSISFCMPSNVDRLKVEFPLRFAVYFVIPIAVFACVYFKPRRNRTANIRNRAQKDFTNLVLALVVLHAICFVPFYLVPIWTVFNFQNISMLWKSYLSVVTACLAIAYHSLNPVAVYCFSGDFRQLFKRHLLCWCTPENREPVVRNREAVRDDEQL